jgi:sugar phosphate isomerase/epimerase
MDKHWSNYCTMSIVHFMAFPTTIGGDGPIAATVSKIAEDSFFGAVEITHINDPAERQKTRDVIETSRLKVGFGAQPHVLLGKLNPNSLDEAERQAAVMALKAGIDETVEMGANRMAFLSGRDPGDKDRPAALKALIQSTKELCAYGREKGIGLTCETFDRTIDKKALIGPSDFSAEYAAAVRKDYPDFGLMYDLSHQPLLYEESEEALQRLKPHLVHIHIGNGVRDEGNPGYGDLHPRFGWPGGCNDVDELVVFIRALFKVGYLREGKKQKPWVGFEVKPQSDRETPEQVIAGTKRVWKEAWSLA